MNQSGRHNSRGFRRTGLAAIAAVLMLGTGAIPAYGETAPNSGGPGGGSENAAVLGQTATGTPGTGGGAGAAGTGRDPWLAPFSQDSIWNMPIGSGADYQPANLPGQGYVHSDDEWHMKTQESDPVRPIYSPGGWTDRCTETNPPEGEVSMHIPDDFVVADTITTGGIYETPNNVSTFLKPDGRSLISIEPLCRNKEGGPVFGYQKMPNEDIYGTGIYGTHWGSGLSGFGGSIRHGELTGPDPIRHALKINVWGNYLHYDKVNDTTPGYRWPADRADNGAPNNYHGTNPKLEMGALLAIPPGETAESLGLTSEVGRKFFHALQDYGAYIADDTGWDAYGFSLAREARFEFEEHYGYSFNQGDWAGGEAKAYYNDMVKLISKLQIVDNSAPDRIGGGGERRAPLADPDFRAMDAEAPTVPSGLKVDARTTNSVTLSWEPSADNERVMEYEIYQGTKRVGSTYGNTKFTVTGLKKATVYNFKVGAKDTNLNRSEFGETVTVQTFDGYAENFDANTASGWSLSGSSLEYGRLKLTGWSGEGRAVYTGRTFTAPAEGSGYYAYSAALQTDAGDNNGKTRVYFNLSEDGANGYYVQIGGGAANTVELVKLTGGAAKTLGTYNGSFPINQWDWPVIQVTYGAGGAIKVTGSRAGTETVLFDGIQDASYAGGRIGVSAAGAQSFADNVSVLVDSGQTGPDTEAPTAPGGLQAAELTTSYATLTWNAATDNFGVAGYNVYVDGQLAGTTENTVYALKQLTKSTAYQIRVEAVDGTGNRSAPAEMTITTPAVDALKRYEQNFDKAPLEGWTLSSAEVSGGALQTGNWGGDALAVYSGDSFAGQVTYKFRVNAWGTGEANLIRVYFQDQDADNTYVLETGGNEPNRLVLSSIVGGVKTELGQMSGYSLKDGADLTISYKDGQIRIEGRKGDQTQLLFDKSAASELAYGTIAFGAQYNFAFFDNLSVESLVTDVEPPSVPAGLQSLAQTGESISLSWLAASDNVGVAGYNLYQNGALLAKLAGTEYVAAGLQGDTEYTFTVTARDRSGNVSELSVPLKVKTKVSTRLPRIGWSAVTLSSDGTPAANAWDGNPASRWSSGQGMKGGQWFTLDLGSLHRFNRVVLDTTGSPKDYPPGYEIYVSSDGTDWGQPVTAGSGNTVTDISFRTAEARYVRIVQTGESGSWWSIHELYVHNEPDLQPPAAPAGLAFTVTDRKSAIRLSWQDASDNDGIAGYEVYRDGVKLADAAGLKYDVTGLDKHRTYTFTVKAVDRSGNVSPATAAVSVNLKEEEKKGKGKDKDK
ncbi:fibronectin type III domain-containing protein [Paenibacillus gansuensis]|uniref:Fibronectin type III domain-containing protein n=1 Tax=Paenibacillus gansuensis TaxID=306542 RepID=A0ABW5PGR8_9BACL